MPDVAMVSMILVWVKMNSSTGGSIRITLDAALVYGGIMDLYVENGVVRVVEVYLFE